MKVSEVLELALNTRYQDGLIQHTFMCLSLRTMSNDNTIDHEDYVDTRRAVNDMVSGIWPDSIVLSDALSKVGIIPRTNDFDADNAVCKQLYIWWVFDLKRKGL